MTVAPVVRLCDVTVEFPGPPTVQALRGIDLTVQPNEFLAVVGPSGSGKSTLLNILGLLDRPTHGSYSLSGVDTSTLSEPQRAAIRGQQIGFVFQSFHLLEHRSATENVLLATLYRPQRGPHAENVQRATHLLERVGLSHRINATPSHLSGGERQRVAIARALMNEPALLLCDEPTGNLDTDNALNVMSIIEDLHDNGQTVIVITHDQQIAARTRSQIGIVDGRIQATGASQ